MHGILVGCLYLPNGNPQPGPKFDYKLAWFERLIAHAKALFDSPHPVALVGDYNVVPTESFDIYNPRSWRKDALLQPQTRECYRRLLDQGWLDAIRSSIRRSASTRSGITSGSTGSATPACASITSCSIGHLRRGSRRWASIAGCAAWSARATTRPPG